MLSNARVPPFERIRFTTPCENDRHGGSTPLTRSVRGIHPNLQHLMKGLRDVHSEPPPTRAGLSSWYIPGRTDGFGDRLLMFDNTDTPSLELLRFRHVLASTPGFEDALRDQVRRLQGFRHPAFSPIRAVQHLDGDDGLSLVSVHTAGRPVSELFAQRTRRRLKPGVVTWILRELTPALAALHAHDDASHGALTADRIVLTPEGRLCIGEHVLGQALRHLELPPAVLWRDFGVVASGHERNAAQLDAQADIVQLAGIALSMLLGRPFTLDDLQHRLPGLLDEVAELTPPGSSHHVPPLRLWLERALRLEEPAYRSAAEAQEDLNALVPARDSTVLVAFPAPLLASSTEVAVRPDAVSTAPAASLPPHIRRVPRPEEMRYVRPHFNAADITDVAESFPSESMIEAAPLPALPGAESPGHPSPARPRTLHEDTMREQVLLELERSVSEPDVREPAAPRAPITPVTPRVAVRKAVGPQVRRRVVNASVALALGAVVLVQAAVIVWLATRAVAPAAATALLIESPQDGATVLVNGEVAGATPLQLTVGPETRSIRLAAAPAAPAVAAQPAPGAPQGESTTAAPARAASLPDAAPTRQGGLKLQSPVELTVIQGDRVLGSTSDNIYLAAGTHQVTLVNAALGVRLTQSITVRAGQIGTQRIEVPKGLLSVNAQPWAQVSVDGKEIGETPLANVSLTVGEHDVVFRHPSEGERRERVTIRPDAVTRISVNFSR